VRLTPARVWNAVLGAGLVTGAGCFLYQWSQGLGVTGLSNTVSWGMYIIVFMFLVGVSAGGLIVVAVSELVGSHRFEALNRLAVICSATAVAAAALSILPDIGRPQMMWKIIVQGNPTSPLVWDVVIITAYLTIAAIDLWILTRPQPRPKALRTMAMVTLPVAVLVHSVTAWIFGLMVARPWWNTALLAPLFISSALVSGTALVLVVTRLAERYTTFRPPAHVVPDLGRLLAWFVSVDAFLLGAEILTAYTSRQPDHVAQLDVVLFGRLAPLFWTEVVFGLLVPFVVFAMPRLRARPALVTAASALALLGVFFKRINILLPGMFEPLVGLAPGVPGGRPGQPFRPDEIYLPTVIEWGVLIGIAAFAATLVTIGIRRLVVPARDRGVTHAAVRHEDG
jgi:molybdopterin-containing oxidoreductase family membrane subunit